MDDISCLWPLCDETLGNQFGNAFYRKGIAFGVLYDFIRFLKDFIVIRILKLIHFVQILLPYFGFDGARLYSDHFDAVLSKFSAINIRHTLQSMF